MFARKKKQKTQWGRLLSLLILAGAIGASVYYRQHIAAYWREVDRVLNKPDVVQVLQALRREPFGLLCVGAANEECYMFDKEGIIFDKARTIVGDVIVKVGDRSGYTPRLNLPFIGTDEWQNLYPILETVQNKKLVVTAITLRRAERELAAAISPENIPIYFNLQLDPRAHLDALPEFFKKVDAASLEYIDARIEGRIFYK